jgi:hypothetical protein
VRTNELEADERQPRIGSEEASPMFTGSVVDVPDALTVPRNWAHIHPFGI